MLGGGENFGGRNFTSNWEREKRALQLSGGTRRLECL